VNRRRPIDVARDLAIAAAFAPAMIAASIPVLAVRLALRLGRCEARPQVSTAREVIR
jgi:hypothetical protein